MYTTLFTVLSTLALLLPISLTAQSDTTSKEGAWYNLEELQRIAERVVRANECDELLEQSKRDSLILQGIIHAKDSVIAKKDVTIRNTQSIAEGYHEENEFLKAERDDKNRVIKWLKIGWISTSISLVAVILLIAL